MKIFIDFWNFQLSWNSYHKKLGGDVVRIPWDKQLPSVLIRQVGNNAEYSGTHVYSSINPKKPNDRKLNAFLQIMNTFEGYNVSVKERKPASPINCTTDGCRKQITHCPHCNNELIRTVEKGVDTTIAIELFQFALDNVYDKAILISGDEDLVPAVEYIQKRGKYIIHAGWTGESFAIRKACWSSIMLDKIMPDILSANA